MQVCAKPTADKAGTVLPYTIQSFFPETLLDFDPLVTATVRLSGEPVHLNKLEGGSDTVCPTAIIKTL